MARGEMPASVATAAAAASSPARAIQPRTAGVKPASIEDRPP